MKPFDHDESRIIEKLNQLPMVEDKLDKDEWYQRISRQVHNTQPKSNPSRKIIPILSTVFVIALLFIIVPSLMNTENMESQNDVIEHETYDMASESSVVEQEEAGNADITMEKNELTQFDDATEDEEKTENEEESVASEGERYVIQNVEANQSIVYGAVPDHQAQYVIPFSMIISNENVLEDSYNALSSHLNEEELGIRPYLFDEVHFEIDQENNQVMMNVSDSFTLGEGEAVYSLLDDMLSIMFRPYDIEKVVFQTEGTPGIHLGAMGSIPEMDLPVIEANYKLYDVDNDNLTFLIPIPQEELSIEDALNDLKNSDEPFNVHQTVPENVQFNVDSSENELILNFTDHIDSMNQNEAITMIESILMTAKSYGYEFVSFNNLATEQMGPYQLSDPIKVPEAVNPINH